MAGRNRPKWFTDESLKETITMRTFPTRLLMAFLVVLALGIATQAQAQAQTVVNCNVPFAFSLGGVVHPSGPYSFSVGDGSGSKTVAVRRWDGSGIGLFQAGVEDQSRLTETTVKFRRYGAHYLLSSLSIAGPDISVEFTPTRAEREMMVRGRGEAVSILASR
jgi:hypothetical protein